MPSGFRKFKWETFCIMARDLKAVWQTHTVFNVLTAKLYMGGRGMYYGWNMNTRAWGREGWEGLMHGGHTNGMQRRELCRGGGGYSTLTPIKSMCPGETSDVGKKVANTSIWKAMNIIKQSNAVGEGEEITRPGSFALCQFAQLSLPPLFLSL